MADLDDAWKCYKHPSRRRRVGVCPTCLRDRLLSLCPNCANTLPCPCFPASTTDSSPSFSRFSVDSSSSSIGSIGRISSLIESEPSFRRSRSAAVPFLSSRFSNAEDKKASSGTKPAGLTSSFLSVFGMFKSEVKPSEEEEEEERMTMSITRSKSVSVWGSSESGKALKGSGGNKGWYFPSPMKVFRQSKPRSPLYRG